MAINPSSALRKTMRSGQYLSFVQAFLNSLKELNTENNLLQETITKFEKAVGEVDNYLRVSTKSAMTINVTEADMVRDRLYLLLKNSVETWTKLSTLSTSSHEAMPFVAERIDAARPLEDIIALYKVDVYGQMDDESAKLQSVIQDMRRDASESVTKLVLTDLLTQLETANNAVIKGLAERAKERGAKAVGALKEARLACDEAYLGVEQVVNALLVLMPDEKLKELAATQNAEISRLERAQTSHETDKEKNPSTDQPKPEDGNQPTGENKPAGEDKPAGDDKPAEGNKPGSGDKPTGSDGHGNGLVTDVQPEK